MGIKKSLLFFLPKIYYSQEGEDILLKSVFSKKDKGFFVDIGAHHPVRFSNTYLLYKKGWRGINIDAMPGSMKLFQRFRRRDINLECGISKSEEPLKFYCFNEPALNGFNKSLSEDRDLGKYKLEKIINVNTYRLEMVLDNHLPANTEIDLLSVDAEGFDLEVLESNNWNKYKPAYIMIEDFSEMNGINESGPIKEFLAEKNYIPVSKLHRTMLYKKYD